MCLAHVVLTCDSLASGGWTSTPKGGLGTILSEAPTHGARFNTVEELLELVEDRKEWNALSNCIVNI